VLTSSYFRHHFLLAIRCKKLHGIVFQKTKQNKTRQSFQTTDFTSKQCSSRTSTSTKLNAKAYDFNFLMQPHQQEMIARTSTIKNDTISLQDSYQITDGLSHVEEKEF